MDIDQIGKKAALLSTVEIGLGSLLHGFSVPFAGHFLSLNQGFILTRASMEIPDKKAPGVISATSSLLKSLSPAGKKLTPMLAIGMQGQLYSMGLFIAGNNLFGRMLGMLFLCLWGFIQPLGVYLILFGKDLWFMAQFYLTELNKFFNITMDDLLLFLLGIVLLKLVLGGVVVALAQTLKEERVLEYERMAKSQTTPPRHSRFKSQYGKALSDLVNPVFLVSWIMMAIFFYHSQTEHSEFIWMALRPVAVAYLLFLLLRLFPVEKLTKFLEKRSPTLARALESALRHLK
ncbi:MAG TPA: hypothetical protein VNJ01_10575 [Bacteriovoracaceae bacterium]|nr:hypothetical protein [Bacteriovoracaceae bacterium]